VLGTTPHVRLFPHFLIIIIFLGEGGWGGEGGGERLGVLENKTERPKMNLKNGAHIQV